MDIDIDHDLPESDPMEDVVYTPQPVDPLVCRPSLRMHQYRPNVRPSKAPDRFIFARDPNFHARERFMTSSPPQELSFHERWNRRESHAPDAFGARTKVTGPEPASPDVPRLFRAPTSFMTSRIDPFDPVREVGQGGAWNIAGPSSAMPTDGVRSTSNGRGGHTTSGTNAPMVRCDFSDNVQDNPDWLHIHGKRVGAAMDFDQANRVLDHGSGPRSPVSSPNIDTARFGPTIWRDNAWTKPGSPPLHRPRTRPKKTVPIIPFRYVYPSVPDFSSMLTYHTVLDAPALRDDYYCSLLAYSDTAKCLAVGLGTQVYTWSESRGVETPDNLSPPFSGHVTSLSFSSTEGGKSILAVGRADGHISLWSPSELGPRLDYTHRSAISCVCFSPRTFRRASARHPRTSVQAEYLLVGDEDGHVYLYSVEWPPENDVDIFAWSGSMTVLARFDVHTQQICGLAWSLDGQYFASGGNDNAMFIFETRRILHYEDPKTTPLIMVHHDYVYNSPSGQDEALRILPGRENHRYLLNAAVKALAFCPWQPSLLAAGGGSNDRCIHFYHTTSGAKLATIDCSAQVTSLIWSRTRREIAATFGFTQPDHLIRVAVFSWPTCECIQNEERALWAIGFPGGPDASMNVEGTGGSSAREGTPWYARRTSAEGCLVIASSEASIKFHEVWSEDPTSDRNGPLTPVGVSISLMGSLGGSDILEGLHGAEKESAMVIR
ncbi:WD40 repeat-like protein [Aureobasidium pullulans]|uniref:WD40 repeat-like protein n=1 Tax=Aureobasidium pullulans TaxID=5580 RepID=A0A4S9TPL5_AURPU|nr:WD40 repeat-like protein [Aureobasidium pullulans]